MITSYKSDYSAFTINHLSKLSKKLQQNFIPRFIYFFTPLLHPSLLSNGFLFIFQVFTLGCAWKFLSKPISCLNVYKKVRGCLVSVFKQQFSVFKQHFTYFNTLFHPHVFSQKFSNNNFQFLNTCTKRALNILCFRVHKIRKKELK